MRSPLWKSRSLLGTNRIRPQAAGDRPNASQTAGEVVADTWAMRTANCTIGAPK